MKIQSFILIIMILALDGFLMGFDASVISGVNEFIDGVLTCEVATGLSCEFTYSHHKTCNDARKK